MQQKREKQRVSGARAATKRSTSKEDIRTNFALPSRIDGNISGTNIAWYSTVRQKILLGPGCAPEFCLVECYSSRSNFEFSSVRYLNCILR